jgi:hypothetical protein
VVVQWIAWMAGIAAVVALGMLIGNRGRSSG